MIGCHLANCGNLGWVSPHDPLLAVRTVRFEELNCAPRLTLFLYHIKREFDRKTNRL